MKRKAVEEEEAHDGKDQTPTPTKTKTSGSGARSKNGKRFKQFEDAEEEGIPHRDERVEEGSGVAQTNIHVTDGTRVR